VLVDVDELEVGVKNYSRAAGDDRANGQQELRWPRWANVIALLVWLLAGSVAFLPFALGTSPWDAVTFRVPGNQGNWWHLLAGLPFFLAYPMIWLRMRSVFSRQLSTRAERRFIWAVVGLSTAGTILVEAPFLMHLAGTSQWQRLLVLSLGFGTMITSALILLLRRRQIPPTRGCMVGLVTAYLANLALCLVVYSEASGSASSRSGWFVSMVLVWPITVELLLLFVQTFRTGALRMNPGAV
jgi:hypothetical protein